MTYSWVNKIKLETLIGKGENDILQFESPGEHAEVYIKDGTIEKVIFKKEGNSPVTIIAHDAQKIIVGKGNTERNVYHYLKPNGPAPTMRLGITVHNGEGTWSSLPHEFELNTEPGFEEIFFYILTGGNKKGIQVGKGVWCDNSEVDAVWPIKDHAFGVVPMGYHPVVGEPGVRVSYIWVYLAKEKKWEKIK